MYLVYVVNFPLTENVSKNSCRRFSYKYKTKQIPIQMKEYLNNNKEYYQ